MPLFQRAPATDADVDRCAPLDVSPEEVGTLDEAAWYARVFRGDDVPQLTARAVIMGSLLGFFLSFANIYIGLMTGWLLGVNLTACILSFTIWGGLHKAGVARTRMTILETNCMQSTASAAGYSTGEALVKAIPAMLLLSVTPANPLGTRLPFLLIAAWVLCLAVLGVTLAVPLKRNIINHERLRFPSGTAAAVMLQGFYSHGREAVARGRALFATAAFAVLVPLFKDLEVVRETDAAGHVVRHGLLPAASNVFDGLPRVRAGGKSFAMSDFGIRLDHSVVLIGAGAIIGLRVTASMLLGGLVLAFVITPQALEATWTTPAGKLVTAATRPLTAWKEIGVWFGAPLLATSALTAIALRGGTIVRALRSVIGRRVERDERDALEANVARTEVPGSWFAIGMGVAGTCVILLAWRYFEIPPYYGALAVAMTLLLGAVSCRATGETDVTPGSAMGKIMQLTYGILIPQSTTANLMTAGITSGASLAASDLLNDLKSGYLLGAHPRRQFVAQLAGTITGTLASCLAFAMLVPDARVLTGDGVHEPKFAAPGAQQWRAIAEVFAVGIENLHPMARAAIAIGGVAGIVLALADAWAPPRVKRFVPSPTGFGLGLILPFQSPLSMFFGAVLAWAWEKLDMKSAERFVVPAASGLIAGESVIGVIVAALNNFVL